MFAGRFSWLCHGTTPPGCTTSLRKRIFRPSNPDPIGARSIDEITVSVTLEGGVGPGFIASTAVLPAGQSAAHDLACIIGNAHAATAVIIRVVENPEIILIGGTPVLACWITRLHEGFVRRCLAMNYIGPNHKPFLAMMKKLGFCGDLDIKVGPGAWFPPQSPSVNRRLETGEAVHSGGRPLFHFCERNRV